MKNTILTLSCALIIVCVSFTSVVAKAEQSNKLYDRFLDIINKTENDNSDNLFEIILIYIWAIANLTIAVTYYFLWLFFGILPPVAR